jgi:hypothetical protein
MKKSIIQIQDIFEDKIKRNQYCVLKADKESMFKLIQHAKQIPVVLQSSLQREMMIISEEKALELKKNMEQEMSRFKED